MLYLLDQEEFRNSPTQWKLVVPDPNIITHGNQIRFAYLDQDQVLQAVETFNGNYYECILQVR